MTAVFFYNKDKKIIIIHILNNFNLVTYKESKNFSLIQTSSDYKGALTKFTFTITDLDDGACDKGTSNIPSTSADGALWIQSITYESPKAVQYLYNANTSSGWTDFLNGIASYIGPLYGQALSNKIIELASQSSIASIGGIAISKLAGASKVMLYVTAPGKLIRFLYTQTTLKTAVNNGYGLLHIQYSTSYHGSWYQSETQAYWTTCKIVNNKIYNKVFVPNSIYGTGSTPTIIQIP